MAYLPPRKLSNPNKTSVRTSTCTPLQILLQMGIPKQRALKALAATGHRSVQLASDWLLTHVSDSSLDLDIPREYILYACPTGQLLAQLKDFWEKSKLLTGWNGALNYPPHITLISFFKAPDEYSLHLSKSLKYVVENVGPPPNTSLLLEPYISQNFMGLFVCEDHADYLKRIALQYVKHVSKAMGLSVDTYEHLDALATCFPWCTMPQDRPNKSICLEPHMKALHITLAYQYQSNIFNSLRELVDTLQLYDTGCNLELRLYSRDSRFSNHQVYKVKQEYEPKHSDELELVTGDYIYIDDSNLKNSSDGWVQGTSWLTGVTGLLPAVYTVRTAESDAWTLHKAISLNMSKFASESDSTTDSETPRARSPSGAIEHNNSSDKILGFAKTEECFAEWKEKYMSLRQGIPEILKSQDKVSTNGQNTETDVKNIELRGDSISMDGRWIFALRHGERVDFTYGSWVPFCFNEDGVYQRKDLNMPLTLPERTGGHKSYISDTPLTRVGELQAELVGEGLRLAGVQIHRVYSSPALRSIQTAHNLLKGLQCEKSIPISIEPGLFEYKSWYTIELAPFMTLQELHRAGYNVDFNYNPYYNWDNSIATETIEEFYDRHRNFIYGVLKVTSVNENIIFVGHACTLDLMYHSMCCKDKPYVINPKLARVPYCGLAAVKDPPMRAVSPPCPPHINTSSGRFNWKELAEGTN